MNVSIVARKQSFGTVIWDSDFSFEDMGYEGEGIVHCCHCTRCGAQIEYKVSLNNEEEEDK